MTCFIFEKAFDMVWPALTQRRCNFNNMFRKQDNSVV